MGTHSDLLGMLLMLAVMLIPAAAYVAVRLYAGHEAAVDHPRKALLPAPLPMLPPSPHRRS